MTNRHKSILELKKLTIKEQNITRGGIADYVDIHEHSHQPNHHHDHDHEHDL